MEFLKAILGDALYAQFEQALNAYNGNEANKDKQVKLANLSSGEYVGKGKYDALQAQLDGKTTELDTANGVIAELKKGTKGNEELQGKITTYENTVAQLQAELAKTRLDNAIQLALRDAKAVDPDYLAYKLHEKYKPEELTLDENGKVKGMDEKLSGLKTQFPTQFEASGQKKILENKLDEGEPGEAEPKNLEDALKLAYGPKND
ncbi:phage scaffolding protein [Pseudoflavonifractor sp. MSJ-30]|uniref:phage scaffolding protein n=1 Tax=Pseudoflavonifractor sp. MSJ-30 TaxID=2841525 RepID=UPI001C0FB34A|nr:phage scaffolding protein [Pseudoflavonifractor sp. MSJ-30]MBU5451947.1 phage scaffolding protein [Pseudoflavonifractor sp. MSJ-30]